MKKLLLILCLLCLFAGCSSKSAGNHYTGSYAASDSAESKSDSSYPEYEPAPAPSAAEGQLQLEQSDGSQKLVYTGYISIETKEMEEFLKEFSSLVTQYRGITQNMNENNYGNRRYISLTLRIPADDFDEFIEALRSGSGSVTNIHTNVDNITRRYNNNEIEIEALEIQHARLLQLMAEAKDLSDIILIEDKLTNVETRLNTLKSYRSDMDEDVAYSTISIDINEVKAYTETSFGQRMKEAFQNSWIDFVDGLGDFLIGLVYFLPTLLLVVVLFFLFRKPVRALFAKISAGRRKAPKE